MAHNIRLASTLPAHIAVHRRQERTVPVLAKIVELGSLLKTTCTEIAEQVERQVPGIAIWSCNIINVQRKVKMEEYGLRSQAQQFL